MRRERTIYALIDPEGKPFYVGQTTRTQGRFSSHRTPARFGDRAREMRTLEVAPNPESAKERETHWIKTFREQGFSLENKTNKGTRLKANPKYICLETAETFGSIFELADHLKIGRAMLKSNFSRSPYGENVMAYDYNWAEWGAPPNVQHFARYDKENPQGQRIVNPTHQRPIT